MMEFNDHVMMVTDARDIELRGIEVLIRLVPFIERDVEERCAALEEEVTEGRNKLFGGAWTDAMMKEIDEEYERMKGREQARLERLRRGILERAGRVFPELKAADAADVRCTMDDVRCGSEAPSAQDSFRPVSADAEPSFNAADKERDAQCVFSGEGDGCPSGRAKG